MTLSSGSREGSYEILSLLGKGGMGEVYRARDLKLRREVAIKVLPEGFCRDPERIARFQREAEVLASLNHSNIAAIYHLEEARDSRFLVLELVEGETLAERISRGPLPIDEAIAIAKQIAEAFEAAHEKGIVHRDLKPANVKLTPDGKVKVLDFGLAKIYEPEARSASLSNSPTMSAMATGGGVILGTAAYMSPEQARGKTVDRRSDIWAFGCVLYEMLTGKQTFPGEEFADILARILERDPDLRLLPAATPPRVRAALSRCLDKNPRRRFQDIGDVRFELEEANADSLDTATVPTGARAKTRERAAWAIAALAVFVLIAAAGYFTYISPPASRSTAIRLAINPPADADFSDNVTGVISPNGRQMAFVARDRAGKDLIWIRNLDEFTARALAGTDGATYPFWSPDSRFLGFFAEQKLKKIEVSGGPAQTLGSAGLARGGTWNAEGTIVFSPSGNGPLFRISADGGDASPVTTLDSEKSETSHRWPYFLPDGEHFVYKVNAGTETNGIYVGGLGSGEKKRLASSPANAVFAATGYLLFLRESTLIAQRFDPERLEFNGEGVPIAEGISVLNNLGSFSTSSDGILAFRTGGPGFTQLTWFDRNGKTLGPVGTPGAFAAAVLSPDDKKVAFGRDGDIWLLDLIRGTTTRLTFDPASDQNPVWSPDGSRIVFQSNRAGSVGLYEKVSSGAGTDELLLPTSGGTAFDWSVDGQFITYINTGANTAQDLYLLPMTGDRKPIAYQQTEFSEYEHRLSPDSRWMAYSSNESGRQEIYVQPFPASGGKWQISTAGGVQPQWRRDGKELFFLALDGTLMAADVKPGPVFEAGIPYALFKIQTQVFQARNSYSPTADGQRFLVNSLVESAASSPISVVIDWTADLKK